MSSARVRLWFVAACAISVTVLPSQQLDWHPVRDLHMRYSHSMAYDPIRERTVMFGGAFETNIRSGETWEWTGSEWVFRDVPGPTPRAGAAMAWDPRLGEVLLFGGVFSDRPNPDQVLGDTWSWNGQRWRQIATTTAPSPRAFPSMATDPATNGILLFGGAVDASVLGQRSDETWTWDGSQWSLVNPTTRPPAGLAAALVAHPRRPALVKFGGLDAGAFPGSEIWDWDGADWSRRPAPSAPVPERLHFAATDSLNGRILALEHPDDERQPARMWWLDDNGWVEQQPTSTHPSVWPPNYGGAGGTLVLDSGRQQILRYGALTSRVEGHLMPSTWRFDLAQQSWSIAEERRRQPLGLLFAMAPDCDRGRMLLFGSPLGSSSMTTPLETWVYDDGRFEQLTIPQPDRWRMAGSSVRLQPHYASGLVVMHGDSTSGSPFTRVPDPDTWLFDGQSWERRLYPIAPRPDAELWMTYSPSREEILAIGGFPRHLWSFEPANGWQDLGPAPVRGRALLCVDVARDRLVALDNRWEVWEWDGIAWTNPGSSWPGPAVGQYRMGYSPEAGGVIAVPQTVHPYYERRSWLWDGTVWTRIPISDLPAGQNSVVERFVYDPVRGRVLALLEGGKDLLIHELYSRALSVDRPYPRPGETMTFRFEDAARASDLWFVGLSLSRDTGIPLFDTPMGVKRRYPLDPDFLLVATLTHLRGRLSPAGIGSLSVAMPNDANLLGVQFHAAALTFDGTEFTSVSNELDLEIVR